MAKKNKGYKTKAELEKSYIRTKEEAERITAGRAKLSDLFKKAAKQGVQLSRERTERENSIRRTDEWKKISVSDQNRTGNNYSTYAAKMIRDTPGALQREEEREAKRREEIRKQNQPIVDRVMRWNQPGAEKIARQAHNDLVLGGQKRQQTATEKQLTDTAASIARRVAQENPIGTKKQVDLSTIGSQARTQGVGKKTRTGAGIGINSIAGRNAAGADRTKERTQAGTVSAVRKTAKAGGNNLTVSDSKTLAGRTAETGGNRNTLNTFLNSFSTDKAQGSRGPMARDEDILTRHFTNVVKKAQEAAKAGSGYDSVKLYRNQNSVKGKPTEDIFGRIGVREYNGYSTWMQKMAESGVFDNGTDPTMMTDEGLRNNIAKWDAQQRGIKRTANTLLNEKTNMQPGQIFGKLAEPERRNDTIELADNYFRFEYSPEMFEGDSRESIREMVYNRIMEDRDTYEERTAQMTEREKEAFDRQIDAAIEAANNPTKENTPEIYQSQYGSMISEAKAYGSYISNAMAEQKRREKQAWYDNLVATKFVTENGTYNEALIPAPKIRKEDFFSDKIVAEPQGTDIEKAYYWANHPGGMGIGTTRKEWFMLPEQLDMFNRMFAHDKEKGSNLAEMYLKALDGYLSSAKVKYEEAFARETADIPVLGTVAHGMTFPVNVGAGLGEAFTAIAALAGNEEARDKSSNLHSATRWVGNIRDERGEKVDDWVVSMLGENARGYAKQAMGILDSIGDNLFAMGAGTALAGGSRNAAMKLVQTIMSGEATAQSFVQDLDAGVDPTTAAIKALGQGAIEAITEKYSLETLLDPNLKELLGKPGQRAAYFAKSFLAEGSEEGASNLLGNAADVIVSGILGNETEARRRYNELVVEQGLSDKQAERQILAEQAQQLGAEMLAGGISGGIFAGGQIISNRNLQSKAGQQARTNTKGGGIDALIYTGLESDKGSMAYQQAAELKAKQEQGKTVSNQEAGRLAQTMETEAKETLQASMQGEPVTENQVERSLRTLKSISDVMNNDVRQEQNGGLYLAGTQDIRNAEGQVTKGAREVLIDGKVAQIEGVRSFKDQDGKWNLKLKVNGQEVDPDSILNTNYHAAQILRQAAINPEMYSGQFVETLLEAEEKGLIRQEIGKALKDAKTVRTLSYMGLSADEISNITRINVKDDKMLSNVWQQGALEHGENRQEQVKGANRKTEGIVKHDGSLYKSDEWNNWFSKLDENQKAQVDTIAGIAQRAGIEVDFRDMDSETYGLEGNLGNGRTGIAVNMGGIDYGMIEGNKTEKGRHNMLVTFGHEMTHWLQRNSMQGYNRLERFVANEYIRENGVDKLMSRLNKHMTGADNLSLEDALSEVVADSCDQILSDENVMRHIQDTDSKLYTEVKGFVRNLVDRFKTAMRNMSESASRDGRSMAGRINQISKVWLGAYDEAISGMIQQGEEAEGTSRKSVAELSDGTRIAIEDSNILDQKPADMTMDDYIYDYLMKHINDKEISQATSDVIYLGEDLPHEYISSDYTKDLKRGNRKKLIIKERAAGMLLDAIVAADNKNGPNPAKHGHNKNAKLGVYKYNTKIAFPSKDQNGNTTGHKVYTAQMVVNHTSYGHLELYDILGINKDDQSALKMLNESAHGTLKMIRQPKVAANTITQSNQNGNTRKSRAQLDDDYEQARTSGDNARMREIVDESARSNGYIPVTRFHQTGEKFTEFKTDNPVAGANDSETPNGIFFKDNDHDIGVGGDYVKTGRGGNIQMPVYLKYENMLHFKDRKEAVAWYKKNVPGYQEARDNWDRIVKEKYDPQFDALEKEMFDPETTEDRYEELEAQEEKLIQELGKEENKHHRAMKELLNQYFLNGNSEYDGIELDYDGHRYIDGKRENVHTYIVFNPSQVKSADLVTYDNDGKVIPPSERFRTDHEESWKDSDIRYSKAQLTEEQQAEVDAAEENGIDLDVVNHTASRFSRASYERSEYYKDPKKMARMLAKNVLGSESKANIAKAKKWIQDVTSISAMIADRSDVLDYVASPGRSSFKSNPEYGGSIDSSTICAKRLLQTGTIDAIQRALPDYAMSAEDFLQVRRMMKERGYEVSCGLCFVESSRKNIAKYAQQFMNEWNSQHPDNKVNMTQINTVLGLEDTRLNRKEVYEAYEKFMNKLAQRKPKLFEMRSEYNNDIIKHFRNDSSVEQKNKNGGMRINSFSDFEIVHLIDMMQVIMDMGNVGLAGQAYTKVREFAEALGPTGLKINMSMIAKGVDENGKIIFDEVEGMKWADVEDLREKYADNVGTVCVVFTEDQLMAAMADDRIDFIIPFHRSQWKKSNYKDIGLPENTKDFTYWQNERYAKPVYGKKKDGSQKKLRATNYMPNEYWDPNKSGKENAEAYLKMCYENNKIPKFWKWLQSNGDGSYSLKADGSTDGYWKLLGDFKMYNHQTGEYAPQMPVQPNFDMDACERMLREYKGGHNSFPEAEDVVRDFVKEKKEGRKGISTKGGKIQLAGNEIDEGTRMSRWTEEGMDVNAWMNGLTPGSLQTADEGVLLQAYKDLRMKISLSLKRQLDYKAKIAQLEGKENLTAEQREDLRATKNRLEIEVNKLARLEDEMYKVTSSEGYAGMMYRENMKLKDYIEGKTQDQVRQTVEEMVRQVQKAQEQIAKDREEIKKLAETQAIKTVKSYMSKSSLGTWATRLRKAYNSGMNKNEVEDRLAEMALKDANGQDIQGDIETLAQDLLDKMRGQRTDELDFLRGQTLYIGKSLAAELRAENSSIKELQSRIRGSGVTLKTGDNSRLEEQWAELRGQNGALVDVDGLNPIDQLHGIVDFIASQVEASRGINQNKVDFDEVALMVKAAVKNIHTFITDDPAARAQIENLMKQIQEIGQKTGDVGNRLEELSRQMDEVVLAGQKAKGWTTILQRDVADAIRYYNKTAAVAAQEEKTKVRKALIEQLRSENTRKLMVQRDKYEERMKKDRKARELAEDNKKLRSRITTNMKWIKTRLTAETDQKNIPEEAKKLARFLSRMLVEHDLTEEFRSVMNATREDLKDFRERLVKMDAADGEFDMDTDLDFLVITAPNPEDNDYTLHDKVIKDLMDIESGLLEYRTAEGQGNVSLADRKAALDKIQDAVAEIRSVIQRRGEAFIKGKRYEVATLAEQMENEMARSRFKGERKGFGRRARNAAVGAIGYGNLTPEYFFKNLRNGVMSLLHSGFQDAENRSGLEAAKAQAKIAKIAEETGFKNWDGQEKHKIRTKDGETEITTEQLMALYATWKRESNQLRPEETAHLLHGGFVLAENKDDSKGKPRREKSNERPIRLNEDQAKALGGYLTDEQRAYVDAIVDYMSGELAELGNEASMDAYGIKKFTEQFYFPIKSWGGVLNKKSDAGITSKNDNRAMRQSFTKRIKANAQNAIEIGDFTPTAMKHIVGMITFNTVGPAVENMNKVLNQQLTHGEVQGTLEEPEDNRYKMNLRASFKKEYGAQALEYLEKFMADVNGGVTSQRTAFDSLLSIFKKNAVAGSLSVAAQQPLSYIRAAMMINPKYLAQALSPAYWKGSYEEMMKHSGVAVIKKMGKFDMNFGRSMQDYITPEGMVSKGRKLYETISEKSTSLPEMMDAATWTRMWTACKLEQKALNPEMDPSSDEFLDKVGERFNEVMRRTQVYDSVMTKSQNMRSKHFYAKTLTSFMAEPTLSLNVLADAVQNAKEEGGKKNVMKALATFALSAAAQAGAKALFGAGRSPDKKKTKEENFWNRFGINLLSEANPMSLIPGYSQLMDLLMNGELNDDTMGVIGKAVETLDNIWNLAVTGETKKGLYRDLEDSVGQLIQYITNIPAKNIMRDFRAMVNWFSGGTAGFTGDTYAQRPTSSNVLKYQLIDTLASKELMGLLNEKLGEAGYGTKNDDYYRRIYSAEVSGDQETADGMKEYLLQGKGVSESKLNEELRKLIKADDNMSAEDKYQKQKDYGLQKGGSFILSEYEEGNLTREDAERLYRQENPNTKDKDVMEAFDKIDYEKKTGREISSYSNYTPLYDAIDSGKEEDYKSAAKELKGKGYEEKDINEQVKSHIIGNYKDGNWTRKETETALKKYRKDLSEDDIWWVLDRIDYKNQTGKDAGSGQYYRLYDAIESNKSDNITGAVQTMLKHGVQKENIKKQLTTKYKQQYLDAGTLAEKNRIRDAITKAYKAIGFTAEDANKAIDGWAKEKKNN